MKYKLNKKLFIIPLLGLVIASLGKSQGEKLELYQEYPQPGEAEEFAGYAKQIQQMQLNYAVGNPISRPLHSKAHGCLKGTFKVNSDIPEDMRYGIFKPGAEYKVWSRFSNASGTPKADTERDMRGFALKLPRANGEQSQDFLMTNGAVHFAHDAKEMMEFGVSVSTGKLKEYMATHPASALTIIKDGLHSDKVGSMTTETYWSRAPFKIGPKAMKFNVVPCNGLKSIRAKDEKSPTYLTDDLRKRASEGPICFDFRIQMQKDADKQPIEDAAVEWEESDAPSVSAAKITFEPQVFDSTAQQEFCQSLEFNPWHASADLQPLGNMNRARRIVYPASVNFRDGSWAEPTGDEKF